MKNPIANIVWLAIALACGSALAGDAANRSNIRWAPDLNSARQASAQFKVPLLVHFYGDHCLPCKTLDQRVYSQDDLVKTLNTYFICVRVNATQDPQTAAQYGVHSWPTDVFLSHDGSTLFQGVCKQDPLGYNTTLQSVMMMNRDRNVMLAAREQQSARSQLSSDTLAQATAISSPVNPQLGGNRSGQNSQLAAHMTPGFYNSAAGQPQPNNQSLASSTAPNDGVISGPMNVANQVQAIAAGGQLANHMVPRPASPTVGQLQRGQLPPFTPAATAQTVRGPAGADQGIAAYAEMNTVPAAADVSPRSRSLPSRSEMPKQHQLYATAQIASAQSAGRVTKDAVSAPQGNAAKLATLTRGGSAPAMMVSNPYFVEAGTDSASTTDAQVAQAEFPQAAPAETAPVETAATQDTRMPTHMASFGTAPVAPSANQATADTSSPATTRWTPAKTASTSSSQPPMHMVSHNQNSFTQGSQTVASQNQEEQPESQSPESQSPESQSPELHFQPSSTTSVQPVAKSSTNPAAQGSTNTLNPPAAVEIKPAFGGYCVVEAKRGQWVRGQMQFAVQHLGQVYWLSSDAARNAFLASPDTVAPVLSGFDPMVLLNEGRLVPGSIHHTLHEQGTDQLFLFSSAESMHAFFPNEDEQLFEKHAKAIQALIKQAAVR